MKPAFSLVQAPESIATKLAASKHRDSQSSIWEPVLVPPSQAPAVTIPIEAELLATIVRPIEPGDTHRAFNDRKERSLLQLLDRLTATEALALQRRINIAKPDDVLANAFSRLVVERRNRILSFLADTRRRAVLRAR